ncbi:MAG: hypothetical protein KAH18_11030 [Psychromonas sp.]|nr:hypothetical protein [Psychromonas sp.]
MRFIIKDHGYRLQFYASHLGTISLAEFALLRHMGIYGELNNERSKRREQCSALVLEEMAFGIDDH